MRALTPEEETVGHLLICVQQVSLNSMCASCVGSSFDSVFKVFTALEKLATESSGNTVLFIKRISSLTNMPYK